MKSFFFFKVSQSYLTGLHQLGYMALFYPKLKIQQANKPPQGSDILKP